MTAVPNDWGRDLLGKYLEDAHHNTLATFANCRPQYDRLAAIDQLYCTMLDNLSFQMNFTPPFNTLFAYQNVSLPPLLPIVPGAPLPPFCGPATPSGTRCTTPSAMGTQVNPQTPTVVSWNYSIEQQLARNTSLRVGYVGSHGYHGIIDIDANTIPQQICSDPAGCLAGGIRSPGVLVPQGTPYFPRTTRPNPYLANAYL